MLTSRVLKRLLNVNIQGCVLGLSDNYLLVVKLRQKMRAEVDVVREIGRSEVSRLKGSHKGPVE